MSHFVVLLCRRLVRPLLAGLLVLLLGACAALSGRDPLNIHVVGIEPLPGEGLEMRFAVKLRMQNPNTTEVQYDGIALDLLVNDKRLASGVSDQRGRVPRFGEAVLLVPVSVSVFAVARQALGLAENARLDSVPYVLRGKLSGGQAWGGRRFSDAGVIDLSGRGRLGR